jgi:hypothetical protein
MREYRLGGRYSHNVHRSVKGDSLCDNRTVLQAEYLEGDPDFVLSLARGLAIYRTSSTTSQIRFLSEDR